MRTVIKSVSAGHVNNHPKVRRLVVVYFHCIMKDQSLPGPSGTKSMLTPPASLGPIFFTIFLCSGCLS